MFNAGAIQCSTTVHANVPFEFEFILTCRAIGPSTSANLMGQGRAFSNAFVISGADGTNSMGMILVPNTAPAVGTGFNSSATQQLDLFGTWSANNAFGLHPAAPDVDPVGLLRRGPGPVPAP